MAPPPPRPSSYTVPTPFPPVSKKQKLLAELYDDWEEVTLHAGGGETLRMVPKCSLLAPVKQTAIIKSAPPPPAPKKSPLSPARDLNSNSLSHDQMLLSLYRQDGEDLSSSLLSNHPQPSTLQEGMARRPDVGGTGQSSESSTVVHEDRNGGGVYKENKEVTIEHFLGMFLIDRSPVSVEQAMASCNSPAIFVLEVEDLLSRSKDKVDRLVRDNEDIMGKLLDIGKHGLVHWSGEGTLKWTCLGEKEDEQAERGWKVEGGERRTRSSRGAVTRGRSEEWEWDWVETEDGGVGRNEGDREDNIYDYDEGDDNLKKKSMIPLKKFKFNDEDDDGEWLKKPSKGKGRGKGRGRGRKLGGRVGKPSVLLPTNTVGLGNYFPTVDKNPQEEVPGTADEEITGAANKQVEEEGGSASNGVSPTTAICNRVLLGTGGITYTRTRTERRGTCPLCSKDFGMTVLETHAARCQGERK